MKLTLSDIKKLSNVEIRNEHLIKSISGVSIDSRSLQEGELFFAIPGEKFDGHRFVDEVIEKGAAAVVINRAKLNEFENKNYPLIIVENTIKSLGELANIFRKKFKGKIVALSGSNGKTTTKEMIYSVLRTKYKVIKTEGNLNNYIGVPLTLFKLNNTYDFAIIEIGINHLGEMTDLCKIVEPNYGCLTNIGNAHLEFLGGIKGVAKAKGEMFRFLSQKNKMGFVNRDDKNIVKQASVLKKKFTFAFNTKADVNGKIISINKFLQPTIEVNYKGKSEIINLNTIGLHTAYNALCAASVGLKFGISLRNIKSSLEKFYSYSKRMEVLEFHSGLIINDCYNANPDSMKVAIETMGKMKGFNLKIAVLGDMLELGRWSEKYHRKLAHHLKKNKIDLSLFFGELTENSFDEAKKLGLNVFYFKDKGYLIDKLKNSLSPNSLLLIKGSRKMKMEEITETLVS